MILIDVFKNGNVPSWLVNIEADIDSRMSELITKDPIYHPLNIRTEEREKIFNLFNCKMVHSEGEYTEPKNWTLVFDNMEDYSWFMLRWA